MSGFRLEVETHIVTGEVMAIQNLIKSVQRAGIEIDDLVLQTLASGEAVLSTDDKERGVVLVDIGGKLQPTWSCLSTVGSGTTAWCRWAAIISPANYLVVVLKTPHNTAEYLKLKYGSAMAGSGRRGRRSESRQKIRLASGSR